MMMKTRPVCEGRVLSVNLGAGGNMAERVEMGAIFECLCADLSLIFVGPKISSARYEFCFPCLQV